jgi:predicted lipid-binding transport protein (Tim44 family)
MLEFLLTKMNIFQAVIRTNREEMMVKTEAKIENITENWTLTKKRGTTDQRR